MASAWRRSIGEIVDDTLRLCSDFRGTGLPGRTFTVEEVVRVANQVLLNLVSNEVLLKNTAIIQLLDGTYIYDLPPDCIRPLRFAMHGLGGTVILPLSVTQCDLMGVNRTTEGDPENFYREFLAPNQVGFTPTPSQGGSTSTRDSDYGLLRDVYDADGHIDIDPTGEGPIRRIRGVPFVRAGTSRVVRDIISPYGNVEVTYVRTPEKWLRDYRFDRYPDVGIPVWLHKDLKYGIAAELMKGSKRPLHWLKIDRMNAVWRTVIVRLRYFLHHVGPMSHVRPL